MFGEVGRQEVICLCGILFLRVFKFFFFSYQWSGQKEQINKVYKMEISFKLKFLTEFIKKSYTTMPFIFVYRTADTSALSRSSDSAEICISCSIHKCEWHSTLNCNFKYSPFHKTLPNSILEIHSISVRFYEMGDSIKF